MKFKIFLSFLSIFIFLKQSSAQSTSNEGNEFWVCFPDHVPSNNNLGVMSVFITSKSNSSGVVSCGTFSQPFTVQANTVREVIVPRNVSYLGTFSNSIAKNKGIKVLVDVGKPKVVVYAHVFAGFRSAATLVLPVNALGAKHYAMSYTQNPTNGASFGNTNFSQFNIIAADANVKVNITPVIDGVKQSTFSITMADKGDVYQYQADKDISGSFIELDPLTSSCKKIAVFSGSSALAIGSSTCNAMTRASLDPLLQQMYPLENWGKSYPIIPFFDRNGGSIFRIIASENNTTVSVRNQSIKLNQGEFYTTDTIITPSLIKSDKPIAVAQYALTQSCMDSRNTPTINERPGDPDMVMLNALEYSIDNVTMYSSVKQAILEQYLNVVIPTTKTGSFTINGTNFGTSFKSIPTSPEYSYAQISLNNIGGSNFSLAADTGFNALAYGFGNAESYAYSAGTNLASTSFINAISRKKVGDVIKTACVTDEYDFKLVLPYTATKIVWDLGESMPVITQNNPPFVKTTIDNKEYFEYKLQGQPLYTSTGIKPIKITITSPPNGVSCGEVNEEIVNYDFEVVALPQADFTAPAFTCNNTLVNFTYVEKNIGTKVVAWNWNFGDGSAGSTLKNPSYSFKSGGKYTIKLNIINETGCSSNIVEKEIFVSDNPKIDISFPDTVCINASVDFKDITPTTQGNIVEWNWDIGSLTTAKTKDITYTFSKSGIYDIKLTNTNQFGCIQTITKKIVVNELPKVEFNFLKVCVSDTVNFNSTVISGKILSYTWDFGDGSNDLLEKNKANPKHKYPAAGIYNVKLTVVASGLSCVNTITKTIEIFEIPVAEFTAPGFACNGSSVQFNHNDNGVGKKIIGWKWDFGDGSPISQLQNPTYIYKTAGTYKVKLMITSEAGCTSPVLEKSIFIASNPVVSIAAPDTICVNSEISFTDQTSNSKGVINNWKWDFGDNGTSIEKNPKHIFQTPGVYAVKLVNITEYGCEQSATKKIVVNNLPKFDFTFPNLCLNDTIYFKTNLLSGKVKSWLWDFGDGSNDVTENTKLNPKHKYPAFGNYTAKLTAFGPDFGCVEVLSKVVTVNSKNLSPIFQVQSPGSLCSNQPVTFINKSTAAFGNIVKLEIIYDYTGSKNDVIITDLNPSFNKVYSHSYPSLSTTKNYKIVIRAFTGTQCFQQSEPLQITILGSPNIVFNQVAPVCLNTPKFILSSAKELSGINGTSTLIGKGVVGNSFDPAVAGIGTHEITYTFTASNGCSATKSMTIVVNAIGIINAGTDIDILLGGEKRIEATAVGNGLKFKWQPSDGLSADTILSPIASPKVTTKYVLTATTINGCVTTDDVIVTVHTDPDIPNVFSPNGDGINDTWTIKYLETFVNGDMKIFNRYGQEVFFAKPYNTAWDGKYKGVEIPVGVYYYIIEPNNGRERYKGSITILR